MYHAEVELLLRLHTVVQRDKTRTRKGFPRCAGAGARCLIPGGRDVGWHVRWVEIALSALEILSPADGALRLPGPRPNAQPLPRVTTMFRSSWTSALVSGPR